MLAYLGDLWRWSSGWSYVGGSTTNGYNYPQVANYPGHRAYAGGWRDSNGDYFIHGGNEESGGDWANLYKFTSSTRRWSWLQGSNASFLDSDELAEGDLPRNAHGCAADNANRGWCFGGHRGFSKLHCRYILNNNKKKKINISFH